MFGDTDDSSIPSALQRERLLDAAIYAAMRAAPEARRTAIDRLILIHHTWPLVEYEQAILRVEARERDVALLRDTWR